MKDNRFWISLAGLGLSVAALFFTICGDPVFGVWNVGVMASFADAVGAWNWWIFIFAAIGTLICAIMFFDYLKKRREFEELIDTNSKKQFIKNQEDLEVLSWKLGTEYEKRFDEKMDLLRIKR